MFTNWVLVQSLYRAWKAWWYVEASNSISRLADISLLWLLLVQLKSLIILFLPFDSLILWTIGDLQLFLVLPALKAFLNYISNNTNRLFATSPPKCSLLVLLFCGVSMLKLMCKTSTNEAQRNKRHGIVLK